MTEGSVYRRCTRCSAHLKAKNQALSKVRRRHRTPRRRGAGHSTAAVCPVRRRTWTRRQALEARSSRGPAKMRRGLLGVPPLQQAPGQLPAQVLTGAQVLVGSGQVLLEGEPQASGPGLPGQLEDDLEDEVLAQELRPLKARATAGDPRGPAGVADSPRRYLLVPGNL